MATSEETALAAEQHGSLSIGEPSAKKRKVAPENSEDAEKNEDPTKLFCSACGKESDAVKKCNWCKCVCYCDGDCQNDHHSEHRKECKRIMKELDKRGGKLDLGEELDIGPTGKLPPREECPICMRVLPIHVTLQTYSDCCGKTLCAGCDFQHKEKSEELAAEPTCAFCRTSLPKSDEEIVARRRKRVDLKDPIALRNMAAICANGHNGLAVDEAKCIDLLRQSANLGLPDAQFKLGTFLHTGSMDLEKNEKEGITYWQKAAEGGNLSSRHKLGCLEGVNGDYAAAIRHWRLAASAGYRKSMDSLVVCFEEGLLHHGDLAETLQVFYRSRDEMKSDGRDQYITYLKMKGEYKEEYEC